MTLTTRRKRPLFLAIQAAVLCLASPALAGDALKGYGSFHALMGLHSWGGATVAAYEGNAKLDGLSDASFNVGSSGGFYLSGHSVVYPEMVHVGGFLEYQAGELQLFTDRVQTAAQPRGVQLNVDRTVHDLALGISAKLSGRMTGRFWSGAALDLGPSFLFSGGERMATGFRLFPRLTFDYLPWTLRERFQLGVSVSIGVEIEVHASGELEYDDPLTASVARSDFDYSFVRPVLLVGGTFGL